MEKIDKELTDELMILGACSPLNLLVDAFIDYEGQMSGESQAMTKSQRTYKANQLVLEAVRFCCQNKILVPSWAALRFVELYNKAISPEVRSFDDAFGKPLKGRQGRALGAEQLINEYTEAIIEAWKDKGSRDKSVTQVQLIAQKFDSVGTPVGEKWVRKLMREIETNPLYAHRLPEKRARRNAPDFAPFDDD